MAIGRKKIVGGNWKCNPTRAKALELVDQLNAMDIGDVEVVVAPVALHIPDVSSALKRGIAVAAQNCSFAGMGAYTGELAAEHLVNMDVGWVIIGHSERRTYFAEDDELLAKKLARALELGLKVIFCIGEQREDREKGTTMAVCREQLKRVIPLLDPAKVVLAYEPVWAIGTGLVATPEQAQETHRDIRAHLRAEAGAGVADKIRIQYGGSVSAKSCDALAALPDVDGFLVGSASLKPEFSDIVRSCHGKSGAFGPFMVDWVAYPLLLLALGAFSAVPVHPYAQMLVLATGTVYVGCHRSLGQIALSPGEAQQESVSRSDALQFPVMGSAMLFGLYIVVKFVSKEYLNLLLAAYFLVIGATAVVATLRTPLQKLPAWRRLRTHVFRFRYQLWLANPPEERVEWVVADVPLAALGLAVSVAYAYTKSWVLSNVLGICFSVSAIELISLSSFQVGCILLMALFVYDVFWVFGTEVMVTVAKGIDAPIKLLFPKNIGADKLEFSMLGLGDIVIPGIFVALMLRFDARQALPGLPYFRANLAGYASGLVATVAVMHFFEAAQPALLYLVPACLGSAVAVALARGEMATLWAFSEDESPPGDKGEAKKDK